MTLNDRLDNVLKKHETLKHLRGRHNQLDHAWNRGMGRGDSGGGSGSGGKRKRPSKSPTPNQMGPVPNEQMYRQRAAALEDQVRQGKITRQQSRAALAQLRGMTGGESVNVELNSLVLANRSTRTTVGGQTLYDIVNDQNQRPNRTMLSRFMMEHGSLIGLRDDLELQRKRLRHRGQSVAVTPDQKTAIGRIDKLPYWAQGVNFFKNMPVTQGILKPGEVRGKSAQWQEAYAQALMMLRQNSSLTPPEMFQKAQAFADHMEYMTGDQSPYLDGANMFGVAAITDFTTPLSDARFTANQFDVTETRIQELRRILSFPLEMWKKYFPSSGTQSSPYQGLIDAFNTDSMLNPFTLDGTPVPLRLSYESKATGVLNAITQNGEQSIAGYVAAQFPELKSYIMEILGRMKRGGNAPPVNSDLVVGVMQSIQTGQDPNPDMYSTPTRVDASGSSVPYTPVAATEPQQVDDNPDNWVIDSQTGLVRPRSSVQLQQAIDPGGKSALLSASGGRLSVNSAAVEQRMELIDQIAKDSGLSQNTIAAVLSYWQFGAQTIESQPIPTLSFLQQAAQELFGLELGFDSPLDPYQAQQIIMSYAIMGGAPQVNAYEGKPTADGEAQGGKQERASFSLDHFYRDAFNPLGFIPSEAQRFFFSEAPQKPKGIEKLDDPAERAKLTPDEITKLEQKKRQYEQDLADREVKPTSVIPGAPYSTSDQARRAVLKSIYNRTQELLRAKGVTGATLYRSIALTEDQITQLEEQHREATGDPTFTLFDSNGEFDPDRAVGAIMSMPRNALESWTTSDITAASLGANIEEGLEYSESSKNRWVSRSKPIVAEIVLAGDFDVSRIVSAPQTGFGQFREGEVVVSGSKDDRLRVVSAHKRTRHRLKRVQITDKTSVADAISQFEVRTTIDKSAYYYPNSTAQNGIIVNLRRGLVAGKVAARLEKALRDLRERR